MAVPAEQADHFPAWVDRQASVIRAEYQVTDPELQIVVERLGEVPAQVLPADLQSSLLGALYCVPDGIYRMSPDIPGLVQTSNNLARVMIKQGEMRVP